MAKGHKPRAGSTAYWPRKRAKRIYDRFTSHIEAEGVQPLDFACYKAGMVTVSYTDARPESATHGKDIFSAATVLDAPPLIVYGIKLYKNTPYGLKEITTILNEKLSKDLKRKTSVPKEPKTKEKLSKIEKDIENIDDVRLLVHTQPRNAFGKKKPEVFEISLSGPVKDKWNYAKEKLGNEIKASEVFKTGDFVDVKAVTKGKGFEGPVKRFGIKIRNRKSHGKFRHVGTLGPVTPRRVIPGKLPMPGQMGFHTRTEYNKEILAISTEKEKSVTPKSGFANYGTVSGDYILLKGSVPGHKKRLIMLRLGLRKPEKTYPVEIKKIID